MVPPQVSIMFMLWLPPKVWLQGSQSTVTGRSPVRNGHTCRIICWLADSIRWVLSTPFGAPVEPEVNRIFATASGARGQAAGAVSWHKRPNVLSWQGHSTLRARLAT
jgi:hypothetical protein